MLFAFDPKSGKMMGALERYRRYGHLTGKERDAIPSMRCPHECCGGEVYITPSLIRAGFQATGRAIVKRGKPKRVKGAMVISHKPHAASKDCPERHTGDSFVGHTLHATEAEIVKRNKDVLLCDGTLERNRIVLGVLFEALHGRPVHKDDQDIITAAAKTALTREFIADNPWAYPYMIVLLMGPAKVIGEPHDRVFEHYGNQEIPYKDTVGKMMRSASGRAKRGPIERKEVGPREIQLSRFVRGDDGVFENKPIINTTTQRPIGNFPVSLRGALDIIARMQSGHHDDFDFLNIKKMTVESTAAVNDAMAEAFELSPFDPVVAAANERQRRSAAAKASAPQMVATRTRKRAESAAAALAQKPLF